MAAKGFNSLDTNSSTKGAFTYDVRCFLDILILFFYFIKIKPWHKHAKWPPSDLTPWILTLLLPLTNTREVKCNLKFT